MLESTMASNGSIEASGKREVAWLQMIATLVEQDITPALAVDADALVRRMELPGGLVALPERAAVQMTYLKRVQAYVRQWVAHEPAQPGNAVPTPSNVVTYGRFAMGVNRGGIVMRGDSSSLFGLGIMLALQEEDSRGEKRKLRRCGDERCPYGRNGSPRWFVASGKQDYCAPKCRARKAQRDLYVREKKKDEQAKAAVTRTGAKKR